MQCVSCLRHLRPRRPLTLAPRRHRREEKQQPQQYRASLFGEVDERGGYPAPYRESLGLDEKLRLARSAWLRLPETVADMRNFYLYERAPFVEADVRHGDYHFVANFPRDAGHDGWIVTADSDFDEGYSSGEFVPNPSGSGTFRGELSTRVPLNGRQFRAGYVNLRSPLRMLLGRPRPIRMSPLNCVLLRCRGDGRTYSLNLHRRTLPQLDNAYFDMYTFPLYTRGGPYWSVCKIPVSKFIRTYKGRVQNRPALNDMSYHQNVSVTIADRTPGPFSLEIDYLALYYDAHLSEKFAYELYPVSSMMKLNLSHS